MQLSSRLHRPLSHFLLPFDVWLLTIVRHAQDSCPDSECSGLRCLPSNLLPSYPRTDSEVLVYRPLGCGGVVPCKSNSISADDVKFAPKRSMRESCRASPSNM